MKISVQGAQTGDTYNCEVDELVEIEGEFTKIFNPLPQELQDAINLQYGALATRQQHRTNYQNRLSQLNTAINATNNPLADETVANLAALNRVIARVNLLTNILNVILRVLRYFLLHQDD